MSALYVIATPIGNLEDISLRALRLLNDVKLIAAEDTRTTRHLLNTYDIKTRLTSYYEYNKLDKIDYIINYLKEGDVALVSEAGMPGLSDTGYELITAAIENNYPVIPVPGASAVLAALIVSGLPADRFCYFGFLPRRKGDRRRLLQSISEESGTMVFFEAPHRLIKSFHDILDIFGDRRLAVCREMTKIHEEVFRGQLSQAIGHFTEPRGEFTLVIEGKKKEIPEIDELVWGELKKHYKRGSSAKEAVAEVSKKSGVTKKKVYQAWVKLVKGE